MPAWASGAWASGALAAGSWEEDANVQAALEALVLTTQQASISSGGSVAAALAALLIATNQATITGSSSFTLTPGAGNEQLVGYLRGQTGLDTYNLNELAIAYYQQVTGSTIPSYNDLQRGAQSSVPFKGQAPVDWRNYK